MIPKHIFPALLLIMQMIFSTSVSAGSNNVLPRLEGVPEKMCHVISSDSDQSQGEESEAKPEEEEEEEPDCD